MTFSMDDLRRWPDIEGPDLFAVDAADRLILTESASVRAHVPPRDLVVVGDNYGALTLGATADRPRDGDGNGGRIRVHQDPLTGERALAANAARAGFDAFASLPLSAELVRGARVVLLRLPRSLDALRDIAGLIGAHASPDVTVVAGGRIKHMSLSMNDVLGEHFDSLDVSHARQKSRVLIARGPRGGADPSFRREEHDGVVVCAYGGAFAGPTIDIGTRFLLENLPSDIPDDGDVIDFACGTGVVATALAQRHPELHVYACDQSHAAVASTRATTQANSVDDRVTVVRDDLLSTRPEASASFIALNPPFHSGAAVSAQIAPRLFADAARVLRTGGELWTVWNSALQYRGTLEKTVGPTRQIARNRKFTVTVSVRR